MNAQQLRQAYLNFFQSKGHSIYPSGSLIPYDVTGRLDESLLFNGAGMVQFKPFFRGLVEPPNRRLTTAQKCVRTGDIDEVGNQTHLTFFEMLGNFSFGDYFKEEAIALSWEFLTSPQWLGLDPLMLSFTVFEEDDEAFAIWSRYVREAGLRPEERIFRLGEQTNYWPAGSYTSGPPGPCGPNTEMFYWTGPGRPPETGYTRDDWLCDDERGHWMEIWNDVFIQYEWQGVPRNPERPQDGWIKTGMPNLPFASVDTGMGLERTAAILSGFKSVYDTDVFTPILRRLEEISEGLARRAIRYGAEAGADRAMRIIADHARMACFCIADGILPGNSGRGYVLRRLIRRAVLKGQRTLGFDQPFFDELYPGVVAALGNHYSELVERRDVIVETLRNEEALFRRTLQTGFRTLMEQLRSLSLARGTDPDRAEAAESPAEIKPLLEGVTELPGPVAFRLYDTYGFPLEVTEELCAEAGLAVDRDGYEKALAEAQERSRLGSEMETVYGGHREALLLAVSSEARPESRFLGYEDTSVEARLVQISPRFDAVGRTTGDFQICLDATPFYPEAGGQVADRGVIESDAFRFEVRHSWREGGLIWHDVRLLESEEGLLQGLTLDEIRSLLDRGFFFRTVTATVDAGRRRDVARNHTATHLLHAALRERLGRHVTQAGSLVAPDHLRFDFTHGKALTPDELEEIERRVNEEIWRATPVETLVDVPLTQAKAMGAMALFGEKYGERVRVVRIGKFSVELCGGTHTRFSSEVGLFKILSEGSAASGVRRIEAVTGSGSYTWAERLYETARQASSVLRSHPAELAAAVERLAEQVRELQRKLEKARQQAPIAAQARVVSVGNLELAVEALGEREPEEVKAAVDRLAEGHPARVALAGAAYDGKAFFACKVGSEALRAGAHAGNLVREVARVAEGGGGGKPEFATAGGKRADKLEEALAAAEKALAAMIGSAG